MITEIVPNLFLGTMHDAIHDHTNWKLIVCVAEWDNFTHEEASDLFCQNRPILYCPFMDYSGADPDLQFCSVKVDRMDYICEVIGDIIHEGPVLVHCVAGVERSPLLVMWYLVTQDNYHSCTSLDDAYEIIKRKRPIIENRLNWLPVEHRTKYQRGN